jgi:hypothetical protein
MCFLMFAGRREQYCLHSTGSADPSACCVSAVFIRMSSGPWARYVPPRVYERHILETLVVFHSRIGSIILFRPVTTRHDAIRISSHHCDMASPAGLSHCCLQKTFDKFRRLALLLRTVRPRYSVIADYAQPVCFPWYVELHYHNPPIGSLDHAVFAMLSVFPSSTHQERHTALATLFI